MTRETVLGKESSLKYESGNGRLAVATSMIIAVIYAVMEWLTHSNSIISCSTRFILSFREDLPIFHLMPICNISIIYGRKITGAWPTPCAGKHVDSQQQTAFFGSVWFVRRAVGMVGCPFRVGRQTSGLRGVGGLRSSEREFSLLTPFDLGRPNYFINFVDLLGRQYYKTVAINHDIHL